MFWRNDAGFTFVEQLIGLFILAILATLLPNFFHLIHVKTSSTHLDAAIFLNHVAKEAKEADVIAWKDNRLKLYYRDSVISYKTTTNNRLQRFRDERGFVVMSEQVNSFSCNRRNNGMACEIELESGKRYERSFWTAKEMANEVKE